MTYPALTDMLKNRHIDLLDKRKPATKRGKSIIKKEDGKGSRKRKPRGS
jgi:hypothetical protein